MTSRIFVVGDTHGEMEIDKISTTNFPQQKNLTKDDYLIVLGDWGLVFNPIETKSERYWKDWQNKKNFTSIIVPGNHENYDRIEKLPTVSKFGGVVKQVTESIFILERGAIYTIGGKIFWTLGGAESIDQYRRTLGISYWKQEIPSQVEFEAGFDCLTQIDNKVDYIITHTCPQSLVLELESKNFLSRCGKSKDPTCMYLEEIYKIVDYKHWYCGHMHLDLSLRSNFTFTYDSIHELI